MQEQNTPKQKKKRQTVARRLQKTLTGAVKEEGAASTSLLFVGGVSQSATVVGGALRPDLGVSKFADTGLLLGVLPRSAVTGDTQRAFGVLAAK